jgi:hypothetical protein
MTEIWKAVAGYEGLYEVSSLGAVRSYHRGSPSTLTGQVDRYGYSTVLLSKDGVERRLKVHRLVCGAWHGPCPESREAAHLDGVKANNTPDNLVWATRGENERHKFYHGRSNLTSGAGGGAAHPMARLSDKEVEEVKRRVNAGEAQRYIARAMGLSQPHVCRIAGGKRRCSAVLRIEPVPVSPLRAAASIAKGEVK